MNESEHEDEKKEFDVRKVKTPAVRKDYELIKLVNLPAHVLEENRRQVRKIYEHFGLDLKIERENTCMEKNIEAAKKLMARGHIDEEIHYLTYLSFAQISKLRDGLTSFALEN